MAFIHKSNINWMAKDLKRNMEKGRVNFDNAVQRSLVWDDSKKSLLIHSMIYGFAIPGFYFTRDKEADLYDSLDGKQRCNAIVGYMNDEFELTPDTPPVPDKEAEPDDDGNLPMLDIAGKLFSELPDWMQDEIKGFSLTIYYYENMTEDDVREFFRRLNNGKPLTAVELTRVSTPSLKDFQEIASHDAIQAVVSAAGKRRFTDENIAMQIYNMVTSDEPDFSTKAFRQWAKEVVVDGQTKGKVENALTAYLDFTESLSPLDDKKVLKAVKTRTHFVCATYFCYLALEVGMTQDEINTTLKDFFSGKPTTSDEYNQTVGAGSAKPHSVQTRQRIIKSMVRVSEVDEADETEGAENEDQQEVETVLETDVADEAMSVEGAEDEDAQEMVVPF